MLIPPTDVSVFCRVRNLWDKMSDCASTYTELRAKVIDGAEEHLNKEHLKYFISKFESVINSKRRSSYIRNFKDLVTLLEKRGYIGEANVGHFGQIVNQLPNSGFLEETIYNCSRYMDRNGLRGPYLSDGKIILTHYSVDVKRMSEQLPKYIRFQVLSAFVQIMNITWVFIQCSILDVLKHQGTRHVKIPKTII
jgi:hypothetical protein